MRGLPDEFEKLLISEDEIDAMVRRIAEEINEDYAEGGKYYTPGKKLVLVCILKGSVVFMGELMKRINLPVEIEFMRLKSYSGSSSTGTILPILDLDRADYSDCDLLIIEDIVDTGRTLHWTISHLKDDKHAHSVRTVTLLDKPSRRVEGLEDYEPDYYGTIIPNRFIVGYGLDADEAYRTLPYIAILKTAK